MSKEYTQQDKPLPTGYKLSRSANTTIIESSEHTLQKGKTKDGEVTLNVNSNKKVRPLPEPITNEQLEILIETYLYSYMDKPANMSIHSRNLLAALFELKMFRETFSK